MFVEPSKTGLIVLGASTFANYADAGREAFLHGATEMIGYFRSAKVGLGLPDANVLNLFDSKRTSYEQILDVNQFVSTRAFRDIFVYVVGHGGKRYSVLNLALWSSDSRDVSTSLNIEDLLVRIKFTNPARVYAIVDTCDSGVLHDRADELPIDPEALAVLSNIDSAKIPSEGLAILTANNSGAVGSVLAEDGVQGMKAPLFTTELIKLLREGLRDGSAFGFSLNGLREAVSPRIEAYLAQRADKDLKARSVPQVTDQPVFERNPTRLLSSVAVFPNNDERHSLVARAAKQIRFAHEYEQRQTAEIQKLEAEVLRLAPFESEVTRLSPFKNEAERLAPYERLTETLITERRELQIRLASTSTQRTIFMILFSILFGAVLLGLMFALAAWYFAGATATSPSPPT